MIRKKYISKLASRIKVINDKHGVTYYNMRSIDKIFPATKIALH